MKCKSGKHEWQSEISASRCCDPKWRRVLMMGKSPEHDRDGVTQINDFDGKFVWIRVEDANA